METNLYILLIVAFAALIHSGFSLGASMMALLSGHSISRRRSHARLLSLTGSFVVGSFAMILLLLLALSYICLLFLTTANPIFYLVIGTATALTGLWVLFFYYKRSSEGAALWLPRSFARFLNERTAHTKNSAEAFVLGAASVIYELPVAFWLMLIAASSIGYVYPTLQIPVVAGYSFVAIITLIVTFILIGGGHTGASLTRFRTKYKRFLQTLIGLSMIILGASIFLDHYSAFMVSKGIIQW